MVDVAWHGASRKYFVVYLYACTDFVVVFTVAYVVGAAMSLWPVPHHKVRFFPTLQDECIAKLCDRFITHLCHHLYITLRSTLLLHSILTHVMSYRGFSMYLQPLQSPLPQNTEEQVLRMAAISVAADAGRGRFPAYGPIERLLGL